MSDISSRNKAALLITETAFPATGNILDYGALMVDNVFYADRGSSGARGRVQL